MTERARKQFLSRRGGTPGSLRTTCPALSSQIRSSGKRIVNVCTERQRGIWSAVVSGMSSSFASPFIRDARVCASATRSPPGRSRPGRPSRRGQAVAVSADAELAATALLGLRRRRGGVARRRRVGRDRRCVARGAAARRDRRLGHAALVLLLLGGSTLGG